MICKTPSVLLVGIAAFALLGCAKEPAPAPAEPAAAVADDEVAEQAAAPAPVENKVEKAAKLAGYIQDKPECQQFKTALEQAQTPEGAGANLEQVMSDAYKAGCSK